MLLAALGLAALPAAAHAQTPPAATPTPTATPEATPTPEPGERPDPSFAPPSRAKGGTIATIVAATTAHTSLTGKSRSIAVSTSTSWSAEPQSLLVLDEAMKKGQLYLKVLLPNRPNGSSGWISRDKVTLQRTPYWIDVSTTGRRVTVYRRGKKVRSAPAVVGKAGTPTPHTLAAVYEVNRQPDPQAFLGPWALSLTAVSNVLQNFGGGPGRVAIHGRAGSSLLDPLGSARSHGCVRIPNADISWMARYLQAGTPVSLHR